MYWTFLKSEIKKSLRDPLVSFMIFYPLLFGFLGRYLIPYLTKNTIYNIELYSDIILVTLTSMIPVIYGATIGFSLLDDRDDSVFLSLEVTPLSIHQFLSFRMLLVFVFSFLASAFVLWFSNLGHLYLSQILTISFLFSLSAPPIGLFINVFANNKIEGFAMMKATGILIIVPLASLFFHDIKELFFALSPGFFAAKALSVLIREKSSYLNYQTYLICGLLYNLIFNLTMYRLFLKKIKEN